MNTKALPTERGYLQELYVCSENIAVRCDSVLSRVQRIKESGRINTTKIVPFPFGKGSCLVSVGLPDYTLNIEIQELAAGVIPLLDYLEMDAPGRSLIKSLVPSQVDDPDGTTKRDATPSESPEGPDLLLSGMYELEGSSDASERQGHQKQNMLRIAVLSDLLDRLSRANSTLLRKIKIKLSPPKFSERVQIEIGQNDRRCIVTVDGKDHMVSRNQAILFKHLVAAEGKLVSGPQIALEEDLSEFKADRFRNQLESRSPELFRIIKVEKKRGFRISLPPL